MKKIKGIEIVEIEDLDYNLDKIRSELSEKTSFWSHYNAAVSTYEADNKISKAGIIFKTMLFISLMPSYINMILFSKNIENTIEEAEIELIKYYEEPQTNVKRFRLKCQQEKKLYEEEIKIIDEELIVHHKNMELDSVGTKTKKEISELIKAFEDKKKNRQNKFNFYQACEKKLVDIEEQLIVRQSIENSKLKLKALKERKVETSKHEEIEKEFELYEYYGNLLDSISTNMKKIELDKEENLEELELKEMINQIQVRR